MIRAIIMATNSKLPKLPKPPIPASKNNLKNPLHLYNHNPHPAPRSIHHHLHHTPRFSRPRWKNLHDLHLPP